ncbi:MAG: DegV family protein [Demequinaceae bacterium]|nr:DegV family protein [Demequinaceae bacterium]
MRQKCLVVVDSSASVPDAMAGRWNLDVVPLEVIVDGEPHPEGPGMTSEDVLAALDTGRSVTTSQPSVGVLLEAYRSAAEAGAEGVVSVHISGEVSGTVNAATLAARESPIPVEVVDSRTLAMALGYASLAAASLAKEGASMAEVAEEARRVAASSSLFFTVDSLEYLRRGGRVPRVAAALGEALSVRPILGMVGGEVEAIGRVRTTVRARERVVALCEEAMASLSRPGVAITGLRIPWVMDDVVQRLGERHPGLPMILGASLSAALAAHGGPGTFAIAVADLPLRLGQG